MNSILLDIAFVCFAIASLSITFVAGYMFNKIYKAMDQEDINVIILPSDKRMEIVNESVNLSEELQDNLSRNYEIPINDIGCTE